MKIALSVLCVLLSACATTVQPPDPPIPEEVREGVAQLMFEREMYKREAEIYQRKWESLSNSTQCYIWEASAP